jgi:hypothetical protein
MIRSRGISTKFLSTLCAAMLVVFPVPAAHSQQNSLVGQLPEASWQRAKLSQALISGANRTVEQLIIDDQSGIMLRAT